MKTPSCKNCHNLAVPANAGIFKSIPYFYCRNCKIEVNEWGFEVEAAPNPLKDLDDYLSGEIGRFDNEAPASGFSMPISKKPIKLKKSRTVYDPFHKRNLPVEEDDEEEEEDLDDLFGDHIFDFEPIP